MRSDEVVVEGWSRPRPDARRLRIDVVIGVAVALTALVNLTLTRSAGAFHGNPPSVPEQIVWTVLTTLPLCWRRRWPDAVAVFISAMFIIGQLRSTPEQQLAVGALFSAIYSLGAWGRNHRRAHWVRSAIVAAMFVYIGISYLIALPGLSAAEFVHASGPVSPILAALINGVLVNMLFFGFAYYFGELAWTAERRRHQVEAQAAELVAAHEEEAARSVLHERLRIARELHDVVAHHVSVMGVQASAARRVLDRNPAQAKDSLGAVEQSARTAVDELHRMLGLLRHSDPLPDSAPPPVPSPRAPATARDGSDPATAPTAVGLDRLPELLDSVRGAGLETSLGVFGEAVPLPESLSLAGYRIVQEAATNTLKHADATKLDIRVRYHADELELDVADNGRGTGRRTTGGLGLIGMRERVAAHDGTLETGPRTGSPGFRVRARLPLQRPAPASTPINANANAG
ncbi:sensor histidine kinase [Dactylosporangium matsuzakiense]|uniref:histidine kinase n=1 Tax=Dactylosporangium matsuzakiense TaxID=53360 RepID=A0A9W6NNG3_9ACTN|nr:histidine kinase [Dactylosporangium matsuzakiense]UWZ48172.1 sensor histidine kinase [Dactylosporangium matsuzakiense]GLL03193.1 two-component sensor histidine kinase [Dactylosporangium matsuzakiense]